MQAGAESTNKESRGIVTALARLPRDAHLDAEALGQMLGRCKFLGRHVWIIGTIIDHFKARQEAAVKEAQRRISKISEHFPGRS